MTTSQPRPPLGQGWQLRRRQTSRRKQARRAWPRPVTATPSAATTVSIKGERREPQPSYIMPLAEAIVAARPAKLEDVVRAKGTGQKLPMVCAARRCVNTSENAVRLIANGVFFWEFFG